MAKVWFQKVIGISIQPPKATAKLECGHKRQVNWKQSGEICDSLTFNEPCSIICYECTKKKFGTLFR